MAENNNFISEDKFVSEENFKKYQEEYTNDGLSCPIKDQPLTKDQQSPAFKNPGKKPQTPPLTKKAPPVPTRKPQASYKFQKSRTDKRVSLNCSPLTTNTNTQEYIQRLLYVLGNGEYTLNKGQTIYGFLYSMLSKSCGLIFPYTPQISITHPVNYERTEVTHSNLAISHYKNTPPPTISMDATFTADTRANALHMLSAIWFLRAVTKCDFGERANNERSNCIPGMPPPILYLNGYNSVLDNIPVVVTSFNYTLPKDKDYVALGVNLDSNTQAFNDTYLYSDVSNGNLYATYGNLTGEEGMKYLNGVANSLKSLQESATLMETNRYNNFYFNNWLPTELSFHIELQIQPNLLKHKKKFQLNWYKMGLFNLDDYKGDTMVTIPNSSGGIDVSNCLPVSTVMNIKFNTYDEKNENQKLVNLGTIRSFPANKTKENLIKYVEELNNENTDSTSYYKIIEKKEKAEFVDVYNVTGYDVVKLQAREIHKSDSKTVNEEAVNMMGLSDSQRSYSFDRSGWTW